MFFSGEGRGCFWLVVMEGRWVEDLCLALPNYFNFIFYLDVYLDMYEF